MISPSFRGSIAQMITSIWGLLFGMVGRLRAAETPHWDSPGGLRVLVLAPHPDDEVVGCGGTILSHKGAGDEVEILYITDGRRSRAQGLDEAGMARRRKDETADVQKIFGISEKIWLGFQEGRWQTAELTEALLSTLDTFNPRIIYAPSRIDYHPEHIRVAYALADVLANPAMKAASNIIRIYQVHVPLTYLLTNLITPVDGKTNRLVEAALAAYDTQILSIRRTQRMRLYDRRFYGLDMPIEPFWQVSPAAYCAIHNPQTFPIQWGKFRGLRGRPISDPLAYLAGARQRNQLARRIIGQDSAYV